MIGSAEERNGLYCLSGIGGFSHANSLNKSSLSASSNSEIMLWHKRLGHPSLSYLKTLYPKLFMNKERDYFYCEFCILAKQPRNTYPSNPYKPSQAFHLVHSDVWGPSRIASASGARWFITFIDDHTRVCWVYLMKDKSEASV